MQYIIFGAGDDGKVAMDMLGWSRCAYFYDTNKAGTVVQKRRVLNYEQFQNKYATGHYIVVVASSKYQTEMELFLRVHGMQRYFVFNATGYSNLGRYRPYYLLYGNVISMSFSTVLMYYRVQQYKHIAISNINPTLPYIISEIAFQCQAWHIDYIIDESIKPGIDVSYMGIPCRRLSEVVEKIDCLLLNASCQESGIRDLIPELPPYDIIDCFDILKFVPSYIHSDLKRFKQKHEGERCFIVGNGPSLRMSDLDILQQYGEICFGVNRIFKAFNDTKWRPNYYCTVDTDGKDFPTTDIYHYVDRNRCEAFYGDCIHWSRTAHGNMEDRDCIHVEQLHHKSTVNMPPFSSDICSGVWVGDSVIYCCIQIAAYMGFRQIYLLGVDANLDDKNLSKNDESHFTKNYITDIEKKDDEFDVMDFDRDDRATFQQHVIQAFRKAERYSRAHGFRIFNATRGGKLEAFERVNFDSLFQ